MEVQTIGSDVQVIRYSQLWPLDCKPTPDEVGNSKEDDFMEQPTKKPLVVGNPEKQPRVRRAIKAITQWKL